ncbi:uncharacterized protein TNCV_2958771 [Trichonephila clavipes]|nr:uncharacterized protein TNCV_2958771 [Trichonephila clavipes]
MPAPRNKEKFQQLTEFERAREDYRPSKRRIFLSRNNSSCAVEQFHSDASLEAVERRAPNNSKNWQWTTEEEPRFNLFDHDGRIRVRRYAVERCFLERFIERHSGLTTEVMVWDSISYNARSNLLRIEGNLNNNRHFRMSFAISSPLVCPESGSNPRSSFVKASYKWPRYPSGQVIGSWLACLEFEPSTTKDPPCRAAMHIKSVDSSNGISLVCWLEKGVPAQVSSSSFDHGSKL